MINIKSQVPLASLTTFQIGGSARYFVEVQNENEIREALVLAREKNITFTILAGGSNVLVDDVGFDGLVIKITGAEYSFEKNLLTADAGCNLLALIRASAENGLGGWEKLAGIPGTIGGAVRGNAGAFGSEIKDFVLQISALDTQTLETRNFDNTACDFSYRHSFFKDHPEWIITSASFILQNPRGDASWILELIEETIAERERRHLQNVKAAGSYFMNPVAPQNVIDMFETEKQVLARAGRVPAGWLIEKAGMKGAQVGGAQASIQHPNYIMNTGGASAVDVAELAMRVKEAVKKQFGIELQEEASLW